MPGLVDLNGKIGFPVALYEARVDLTRYLKRFRPALDLKALAERIASPDVKGLFASAIVPGAKDAIPEKAYLDALAARPLLQQLYAEMFRPHNIAALAFPTTPLPAAPVGDDATTLLNGTQVPTFPTFIQNTDPGSNAGIPGLSVPIGRTTAGLPIGLELDGPAGSDRRLLGISAWRSRRCSVACPLPCDLSPTRWRLLPAETRSRADPDQIVSSDEYFPAPQARSSRRSRLASGPRQRRAGARA